MAGKSPTPPSRSTSLDIHKLMDDVYTEMEQVWRTNHLRLPPQFPSFLHTDVLYLFTHATMAYALAFVKTATPTTGTSQSMGQDADSCNSKSTMQDLMKKRDECAKLFAETYARLVLHCSNFGNHKDDERFFECIYYLVSAVVKVGVAPEHWSLVQRELEFRFRGAHYSEHVVANEERAEAGAALSAADLRSTSKTLQGLTTTRRNARPQNLHGVGGGLFALPGVHYCHFSEADRVDKIVAEVESTKDRASHNITVSQSLRDRLQQSRQTADEQRKRMLALASPRYPIDFSDGTEETLAIMAKTPLSLLLSPRVDQRGKLRSQSPVLRRMLPSTEDRVQVALSDYERSFRQNATDHGNASTATALTTRSRFR